MSVYKEIFEDIKTVLEQVEGIAGVRFWRNQVGRRQQGESVQYSYPMVFVGFDVIEIVEQTAGASKIELNIDLHIVDKPEGDVFPDRLFKLYNKVFKYLNATTNKKYSSMVLIASNTVDEGSDEIDFTQTYRTFVYDNTGGIDNNTEVITIEDTTIIKNG
jgi:hypothetical protein